MGKVKVKCVHCKQIFEARIADRKRGWGRFCSTPEGYTAVTFVMNHETGVMRAIAIGKDKEPIYRDLDDGPNNKWEKINNLYKQLDL